MIQSVTIVSKEGAELTVEVSSERGRLSFFLGQHCLVIDGFPLAEVLDALRLLAVAPEED